VLSLLFSGVFFQLTCTIHYLWNVIMFRKHYILHAHVFPCGFNCHPSCGRRDLRKSAKTIYGFCEFTWLRTICGMNNSIYKIFFPLNILFPNIICRYIFGRVANYLWIIKHVYNYYLLRTCEIKFDNII